MYAYFPNAKTYWAFDESLQLQAIASITLDELQALSASDLNARFAEICCGLQRLPAMRYEILGIEHGQCLCAVTADISDLLEEGTAQPRPFEVSRNEIIMALSRQLGWTDAQSVHAADNLVVEVGDELVVGLRNGKCLRMPASPDATEYVRLTQLQFELGRWYPGDYRLSAAELLYQLITAAGATPE